MYGSGTLSEVIGQEMSDSPGSATPMLYDDADDCNKLRYKRWKNVVVFGNTEGGDCFLSIFDCQGYRDVKVLRYST